MKNPKVTVVIATYNRAHFLPASIESVLGQSLTDFELLIIDDASTDDTMMVLNQYDDRRIRVIQNDKNLGPAGARNRALEEARGSYLAILDSDDVAIPDRLQVQCSLMDAHPELAFCGGYARFIDVNGQLGANYKLENIPFSWDMRLLFVNVFIHSTVLFRTAIFREFGAYRDFATAEDYDLFLRISEKYPMTNLDRCLVYYRVHEENISANFNYSCSSERAVLVDMYKRWGMFDRMDLVDVHHSILRQEFWKFPLEAYVDLLKSFKEANKRIKRYPQRLFNQYLLEYFFRIIQNKKELKWRALPAFLDSDLFKWSDVTSKQLRRIFKQSLKGIV